MSLIRREADRARRRRGRRRCAKTVAATVMRRGGPAEPDGDTEPMRDAADGGRASAGGAGGAEDFLHKVLLHVAGRRSETAVRHLMQGNTLRGGHVMDERRIG